MSVASPQIERARLSLLGLSIGDAFGGCFFWKTDVQQRVEAREVPPGNWRWSDDTAMGKSIVECLEQHQEIVPDTLARLFADEYHREPTRGYGTMAHTYLHELGQGVPWQKAATEIFDGQGSYGNGAAMRAGPVGAYFSADYGQVVEQARKSAIVTHAHPEGQAGALAVAVAAAWANRVTAETAKGRELLEVACAHTPTSETQEKIQEALKLPLDRSPQEAAALLGSGKRIISQETVPFSLWCAARHFDDYGEALWATVAGEGDMDTTCSIVGSIVVLSATKGIPDEWSAQAEPL